MSIDPITAAKFDVVIAAGEHYYWAKAANRGNLDCRKVRVAQRAYAAAVEMLTDFERATLEEISGELMAV